jgi:hypothetical protein
MLLDRVDETKYNFRLLGLMPPFFITSSMEIAIYNINKTEIHSFPCETLIVIPLKLRDNPTSIITIQIVKHKM